MRQIYYSSNIIINKNCINSGIFPNIWKKSNVVPVHKKGDKQVVDNYRPVSLLPIFGKILERLIFNSLFEFLHENNLLNENQSGFRPSDSCEYQLLSIVHDIYASFDCNPPRDVRGVFLDISKAFDRVWHEGLIYKIKRIGVTGPPLELIQSFLSHRFQRVVLNGQSSTWLPVTAGVPQGSILGPLLFLIYINDLSNNLSSTAKLFADDTSLFSVVNDVNLSEFHLNSDFTLFKMGIFEAAHGQGEGAKKALPEICHTYPTMMKLGTVIPYLKKIKKIYDSCDTHPEFC